MPSILLAAPLHPGDEWVMPYHFRYIRDEMKVSPPFDLFYAVNTATKTEGRGDREDTENTTRERKVFAEKVVLEVKKMGFPWRKSVEDMGHFDDVFDAIVASENRCFMRAREGGYDFLYFVEADTIPKVGSIRWLMGTLKGKIGAAGGSYHYKQKGTRQDADGNEVEAVVSTVRIAQHGKERDRVRKVNKSPTKPFMEVWGLPFGYTMLAKPIFTNYLVDRHFGAFGTQDYAFFEKIRADGWKVRYVRHLKAQHLKKEEDGRIVAY